MLHQQFQRVIGASHEITTIQLLVIHTCNWRLACLTLHKRYGFGKSENSVFWDAPVKVSRTSTAKPGRKPRPKPVKPEEVPLLTLNYQVLTRGDGGTMQRVDAAQQDFKTGDQMKLAVTPNQSGFLYIVHHSVDNNTMSLTGLTSSFLIRASMKAGMR